MSARLEARFGGDAPSPVFSVPRRETWPLLLSLLGADAWEVTVVPCELGVRVTARGHGALVMVEGSSTDALGLVVFEAARRVRRGL